MGTGLVEVVFTELKTLHLAILVLGQFLLGCAPCSLLGLSPKRPAIVDGNFVWALPRSFT